MREINSEEYKRFFFFGIENKSEVIEGILSLSASKMYREKYPVLRECYDIPNEQFERDILQGAFPAYRQFYRFIVLNDEGNNGGFEIDDDVLIEQLRKEMHQLRDEGKIMYVKAGVYFSRDSMLNNKDAWTRQIYDILIQLEDLEKENHERYFETWMLTRLARAVNRGERDEALKLKKQVEMLRSEAREEGR